MVNITKKKKKGKKKKRASFLSEKEAEELAGWADIKDQTTKAKLPNCI